MEGVNKYPKKQRAPIPANPNIVGSTETRPYAYKGLRAMAGIHVVYLSLVSPSRITILCATDNM